MSLSFSAVAKADEVRILIDIPVAYTGVSNGVPTWKIRLDPNTVDSQLGVLREGDEVAFAIRTSGATVVGQWNQRDRWYSHQTCRKRFLRSTNCTRHYANSDCKIEHLQDPANGALRIHLDFVPPIPGGLPVATERVDLGQVKTVAAVSMQGPRWVRVSGGFQTEPIRCSSLRGTAQGGPTVVRIMGSPSPENWFRLEVTRSSPELEN